MITFVIQKNAIEVSTRQATYTFTSFSSRDTTFVVIYNMWKLARPKNSSAVIGSRSQSSMVDSGTGIVAGLKKRTLCACARETVMDTPPVERESKGYRD